MLALSQGEEWRDSELKKILNAYSETPSQPNQQDRQQQDLMEDDVGEARQTLEESSFIKRIVVEAEKAMQSLKEDLAESLVLGYPGERYYIPRSCLERLVGRPTIKLCLPEASDELLDFIASNALKIFAILVYSCCLPTGVDLKSTLQTFKDMHFVDAKLPFSRRNEQCNCHEDEVSCRHKMTSSILGKLGTHCWDLFYTNQWKFLGLEFEADVFDYTLDEQCILPIQVDEGYNEGFFDEVKEGELNQDNVRGFRQVSLAFSKPSIFANGLIYSVLSLVASQSRWLRCQSKESTTA